jgi:hypothetical protein
MSAPQVDDDLITDYDGMYSVASSEYNGDGTRPPAGLVPGPGLLYAGAPVAQHGIDAQRELEIPQAVHTLSRMTGISGSSVRKATILPCVSAKEGTYESRGNGRYWGSRR